MKSACLKSIYWYGPPNYSLDYANIYMCLKLSPTEFNRTTHMFRIKHKCKSLLDEALNVHPSMSISAHMHAEIHSSPFISVVACLNK